jgi:hypothetical protein
MGNKKKLFCSAFSILLVFSLHAQDITAEQSQSAVRAAEAPTGGLLILTAQVPISFSRMSVDPASGQWTYQGEMSTGISAVFMFCKGTLQPSGDITGVRPLLFFGPLAVVGVTGPATVGSTISGSVVVGGVIGFSQASITIGWDLFQSKITFGLGTKIDSLELTSALTMVLGAF